MMWIEKKDVLARCQNCCKVRLKYVLKISTKNNGKISQTVILCNECLNALKRMIEEKIYR